MPTYDYVCEGCDHQFEVFQSITDEPSGSAPMRQAEAPPPDRPGGGDRLQGLGFYKTDYRSESYKKGAAADKSKTSGSDGAKTTESKPAGDGAAKTKEKKPAGKHKDRV